jgi:hypothetical protein
METTNTNASRRRRRRCVGFQADLVTWRMRSMQGQVTTKFFLFPFIIFSTFVPQKQNVMQSISM